MATESLSKEAQKIAHTKSIWLCEWKFYYWMIKREREEMNFRLVVSTHEFTAIETTMQKYFDDTWVLSGWWELCKQKSHETFVVSWDEKKVFLINNKQKWNGVHLTMHDTIIWIFFLSRTHPVIVRLSHREKYDNEFIAGSYHSSHIWLWQLYHPLIPHRHFYHFC